MDTGTPIDWQSLVEKYKAPLEELSSISILNGHSHVTTKLVDNCWCLICNNCDAYLYSVNDPEKKYRAIFIMGCCTPCGSNAPYTSDQIESLAEYLNIKYGIEIS